MSILAFSILLAFAIALARNRRGPPLAESLTGINLKDKKIDWAAAGILVATIHASWYLKWEHAYTWLAGEWAFWVLTLAFFIYLLRRGSNNLRRMAGWGILSTCLVVLMRNASGTDPVPRVAYASMSTGEVARAKPDTGSWMMTVTRQWSEFIPAGEDQCMRWDRQDSVTYEIQDEYQRVVRVPPALLPNMTLLIKDASGREAGSIQTTSDGSFVWPGRFRGGRFRVVDADSVRFGMRRYLYKSQ